jgi:hypothetical protein
MFLSFIFPPCLKGKLPFQYEYIITQINCW